VSLEASPVRGLLQLHNQATAVICVDILKAQVFGLWDLVADSVGVILNVLGGLSRDDVEPTRHNEAGLVRHEHAVVTVPDGKLDTDAILFHELAAEAMSRRLRAGIGSEHASMAVLVGLV
jgi:hypothetical protein